MRGVIIAGIRPDGMGRGFTGAAMRTDGDSVGVEAMVFAVGASEEVTMDDTWAAAMADTWVGMGVVLVDPAARA
jgi:hypothetical protein